jgi:hypothetical protein
MSKAPKNITLTVLFILFHVYGYGGTPGGGPPPPNHGKDILPPGSPIDTNIVLLVIAAILYSLYIFRKSKRAFTK